MQKGACVFHNSREHTTEECGVIKRAMTEAAALRNEQMTTPTQHTPYIAPRPPVAKAANPSLPVTPTLPQSTLSQIESVNISALQGESTDHYANVNKEDVTNYLSIFI